MPVSRRQFFHCIILSPCNIRILKKDRGGPVGGAEVNPASQETVVYLGCKYVCIYMPYILRCCDIRIKDCNCHVLKLRQQQVTKHKFGIVWRFHNKSGRSSNGRKGISAQV
ncbi:hypothetical protein Tcan_00223 [Toxocara canis]|uniref:Uncharacterized protein n=1 Tax=Toxocara canis TaxID=6265 RepID=A0A0B2VW09_TOXCA|nr:hypothetical protein Tcan_00223 [Toxocara canis]